MRRFTRVLPAILLLFVAGCGDDPAPVQAEHERAARTIEVVGTDGSYRFDAPKGMAECAATPASGVVRCDIDLVKDPTRGQCVVESAFSFIVGRTDAGFLCVTDSVLADDGRTVAAGDRVVVGPVTCTVEDDPSIRCENRAGPGFELRPKSHTAF